jgi:O-antigen/teichoic acid export membrane protein
MIKVLFTIGAMQVVTMAVMLVRTKGLAVLLGPEQFGVLAVIDKLVAVLVQTASLSLPFAAIRFLPALWTTDRRAFTERLRAMSATLLAFASICAVIAVGVTTIDPARWGKGLAPYASVLIAAFLTIPIQAGVPFVQNATAAAFAHNRAMLVNLAHAAVFAASGIAGAWWFGLTGIYALYVLPAAVFVVVALAPLIRPGDPTALRAAVTLPFPFALPREMWRFGLTLLALAFLAPYAALFVHYRVLSDLGPQASGWMQAAMGISLAVRGVLGSAHPVFLTPHLNRGGTGEERMRWATNYQKTLCFLIGVVLPPLLLFPDLAVRVLYSAEFLPGAQFVFLFVVAEILTLLAGTYQGLVLALNRLGYHVTQNLLAQVIMIVVGALTIRRFGIAGAALAAIATQFFLYVSTTIFLRRSFGLRIPKRIALLTLYVVAMLAATGIVGQIPTTFAWGNLLARGGAYLASVAGLAAFLTRHDDYRRLRELARELTPAALRR